MKDGSREGAFRNEYYTEYNKTIEEEDSYGFSENFDEDCVVSNSVEYLSIIDDTPKRQITKRKSSTNCIEDNTLIRKNNLLNELKEKVPNMVPKNMINYD